MAYIVTWKKQPGHFVMKTEQFEDLDEALADARIYMPQPYPLEVTVTDDAGNNYYTGVTGPSDD